MTKKCELESCGKEYETKAPKSRFCSDNCRVKWNYKKNKEGAKVKVAQMTTILNNVLEATEGLKEFKKQIFSDLAAFSSAKTPALLQLPQMERNDANLGISNAGLGSWLDNGAKPVNEPKIAIRRTPEQWVEFKRECTTMDEWAKLKAEIQSNPYLTDRQKQLIFNTP